MKINRIGSALILTTVFAAVSAAQEPLPPPAAPPVQAPAPQSPDGPRLDFATVDKSADGRISKDEALQVADLSSAFDMLDTDRNGALTTTEFSQWSRAGKTKAELPADPSTGPSGSGGAQHMPGTP